MDLFQPDKLVHLFIFAVFVFLQSRGFTRQDLFPSLQKHALPATFLIALALGAGTELIQKYFVPMRVGSIYDFIANTLGCFVGWGLFYSWRKRQL